MTTDAQTPSETPRTDRREAELADNARYKAPEQLYGVMKEAVITLLDDSRTLERELAAAEQRNFALAAGQCIVDGGLLGGDGGTPYCSLQRELAAAKALTRDIEGVLRRNGFVPCDIMACNCGSWHARYGLPERMQEIRDALDEAGHPLRNDNGNLTGNALRELIADRDQLRATVVRQAEEIERLGKDAK